MRTNLEKDLRTNESCSHERKTYSRIRKGLETGFKETLRT